jgi:hypothetical protein
MERLISHPQNKNAARMVPRTLHLREKCSNRKEAGA